jgi:polyisoprenoid-binding protein YceI
MSFRADAVNTATPVSGRSLVPPGEWALDTAASEVGFRLRHLGFATVTGRFTDFTGVFDAGGVSGGVAVASIDTGQPVRDARLRSELFDAERFPVIAFHGLAPLRSPLRGELTIRDVTREVAFDVTSVAPGDATVHLHATTRISRRDFGLDWPALGEAGRVIADRVDLVLDLALDPA